jgi:hypothetical protein
MGKLVESSSLLPPIRIPVANYRPICLPSIAYCSLNAAGRLLVLKIAVGLFVIFIFVQI